MTGSGTTAAICGHSSALYSTLLQSRPGPDRPKSTSQHTPSQAAEIKLVLVSLSSLTTPTVCVECFADVGRRRRRWSDVQKMGDY